MLRRASQHLSPVSPAFSVCVASMHDGQAVKPYSAIPGPRGLPILGNAREMKGNVHRMGQYFHDNFMRYGDIFKLHVMGNRIVLIRDPESIERVLRAEGKYPVRDSTLTPGMQWLIKNKLKQEPGFGFEVGERWRTLRVAIGKQATPRNVQAYSDDFNVIFNRFMDYIRTSRDAHGTIRDIAEPLKYLLVEISAKFVYDSDISVVGNPSGEYKEFVDAIAGFFDVIGRLLVEPPLYKLYNSELSRKFVECQKVMQAVSRAEARKVYSRLEAGIESKTPGMLEQWLTEGKLTEEEAILEAGGIFGAGVDTTANQMAFLLYYVARHPEVQEKLYEEIRSVLGDSKYATPQQLAQMPYVKGCILESFRFGGVVSGFSRVTAEETTLHGYTIPAKTSIIYSVFSAAKDERLFRDPLTFDPARWKRDDRHAFAIQPFGFGQRACYGRRFAELELRLLLVQMVLNFKMSSSVVDLKTIERLAVAPDGDLPITFINKET